MSISSAIQLTLHQQSETRTAIAIDHFGPVLDQACWRDLTRRVMAAGIEFEMPPTTLPGPSSCQKRGKFILKDPAGNLLEFKFIRRVQS